MHVLWDLSAYYDSLQIPAVIASAKALGYPMHVLVLVLHMHDAAMLELGVLLCDLTEDLHQVPVE